MMKMVMGIEGLMRGYSTGVSVGLMSFGIAIPPIIASGNLDLIDAYVRPSIQGDLIGALAVTEPGGGSDVAGLKTKAHKEGTGYRLTGSKTYITSGVRADYYVVLARTSSDPHGGLSLFVLDRNQEGITVSSPLKKTGWRASDTAELFFDDVFVPESHRVGPEGAGFLLTMKNFQSERLALAAYGATTAQLCYEEAKSYAQQRQAFGKTLTGFQVTRHTLADMATQVFTARSLVYQTALAIDQGAHVLAEVAMTKNACAEIAQKVSYQAVQLFGGMGYMRENHVERLSRDARLLPIGGGTQEIMKELISKTLRF